ncbi:MAG: RNA polymerase sigma factor [Cyclobacteriaceae bacterium]
MTALEFSYHIDQLQFSLKPYAYKLTKDDDDAKDLLQETMFKAFKNRSRFESGTNLKAWLYTIMKNTFITNYQRMVRRNTFIDATDNLHYINSSDTAVNQGETSFKMEDITTAINDLTENARMPFLMHYKGFKYQEIAEKLNLPIGTVKNRIHMARKELQSKLYIYASVN